MGEPRPAGGAYMRQLDALRAVAIGTVLLEHWLPDGHPLRFVSRWGTLGVYLFFVLSGFLITDILLRNKDAMAAGAVSFPHVLRQFYIRRFLRIFPIYYAALAVGCLLDLPQMRDAWLWHAAYLSNFWLAQLPPDQYPGPAGVFWTLAVEEQFYLVWPLLILLLPRRAMFWGVLAITFSSIPMAYLAYSAGWWGFSLMTPFAFQFFGAGALVAVVRWGPGLSPVGQRALSHTFLGVGAAGVLGFLWLGTPAVPWERWLVLLGRPMVLAVFFAWMVSICAKGVRGPVGRVLDWSPVVYIGRISYGIYVYHMMVLYAVPALLLMVGAWTSYTQSLTRSFAGRLTMTLATAIGSWHLYELPINQLKRHFPYVPGRARKLTPDSARRTAESPAGQPLAELHH